VKERGVSSAIVIAIVAIIVIVAVGIGLYVGTRGGEESRARGYPAISMNVEASGGNQIIIRVLSGSIAAGEWAYSVSATEGAYNWVTGTEALIAPTVSLGTYAAGTWYVNVKHIDSGNIYFTTDQVVSLPY